MLRGARLGLIMIALGAVAVLVVAFDLSSGSGNQGLVSLVVWYVGLGFAFVMFLAGGVLLGRALTGYHG